MKALCTPLVILALFTVSFPQIVDTPYTISTWRGFRSAAVSYTFDDGCSNQFAVAIPMFNARGYKLTLFTVVTGGMFPGWPKLQSAAAQGHEIASHTVTHTSLKNMASATQTNELRNSRDTINAHIPGRQCVTLAYPYCDRGTDSLCNRYYIASRTCSGQIVSKNPSNWADISSVICGSQSSNTSTAALNTQANNAVASNGWCVYLFHGIENDGGYSPISTAALQGSVDYMNANPIKFWVETFGNVSRYIRERNAASVRTVSRSADSIVVRVTDGLDDTIFNYPITIRRPLPSGWQTFKVTQGTTVLSAQAKDSGGIRYLYLDAVPDAGDVVIFRNAVTVENYGPREFSPGGMKVERRGNSLVLSGLPADGRTVRAAFFDLKGVLLNRVSSVTSPGETILLPAHVAARNTTVLVVDEERSGQIQRFLLQPYAAP